jgi:CubicO group peptidase (beta-lactamase class C family)
LKIVEPIATDPEKRADQLFIPFSGEESPGGMVGVIQDGRLVFARAYGMANLTHGIPYSITTPSNIGSVSKQFTAMAILLLEKQGKLSLDDDVRKHIPELPGFDQAVTLRNMLNHTNGLREVFNLMPLTGWQGEDMLRREEVLEVVRRQEKLQAAPGEEYNYNNSAFILLAETVERISGMTFPEFVEEQIFKPLGMSSSVVRSDPRTIIPGAAQGYTPDSTGFKETGDLYSAYGAGGIYTTVEDLARWMANFNNPEVGDRELITRMMTPDTLNNGDTLDYGLGIVVNEIRGLKTYHHGGADLAHRAYLIYFPDLNSGTVALSNHASFPSYSVAYELAEIWFGDEMEAEEESEDEPGEEEDTMKIMVPEKVLESYAGEYLIRGVGFVLKFSMVDGLLKLTTEGQPEAEMIPQSQTLFSYEGIEATIEFKMDPQGKVTGAVHIQNGEEVELERLAPYEPSQEVLESYAGKYLSDELETFYTLEVQDSTLMLLIRNVKEIKLSSIKEDVYKGDVFFIGELAFLRDKAGRLTGFTVSNGRTKGIQFDKLN